MKPFVSKKKCCFRDCQARGVPEAGYEFFVCAACLKAFDEAMDIEYLRRLAAGEIAVSEAN
jgi:hypothetical protein